MGYDPSKKEVGMRNAGTPSLPPDASYTHIADGRVPPTTGGPLAKPGRAVPRESRQVPDGVTAGDLLIADRIERLEKSIVRTRKWVSHAVFFGLVQFLIVLVIAVRIARSIPEVSFWDLLVP